MRSSSSGIAHPAHATGSERRPSFAVENEVTIAARERAVTGVKGIRDLTSPECADLRRQVRRRSQNPAALRALGRRVEMHDLHARRERRHPSGRRQRLRQDDPRLWTVRFRRPTECPAHEPATASRETRCRRIPGRGRFEALGSSGVRGPACHPAPAGAARLLTIESISRCASCFWCGAFSDFFEDAARTVRIAHVHVGARQVELGADFAHRHRLELRQAPCRRRQRAAMRRRRRHRPTAARRHPDRRRGTSEVRSANTSLEKPSTSGIAAARLLHRLRARAPTRQVIQIDVHVLRQARRALHLGSRIVLDARLFDGVAAGQVDLIDVDRAGALDVELVDVAALDRAVAVEAAQSTARAASSHRRAGAPAPARSDPSPAKSCLRASRRLRANRRRARDRRATARRSAPSSTPSRGSRVSRSVCEARSICGDLDGRRLLRARQRVDLARRLFVRATLRLIEQEVQVGRGCLRSGPCARRS